ncbi:MAG: MDR family MFS transporter [Isosphaeraceae bacterium]
MTKTDTETSADGKTSESVENGEPSRKPERRIAVVALLLAMTVTAMEQLVVSTAMPTIIQSLKGFDIYPWVVSAYLLAITVTTPIYGKLADIFGRKRVLLFGLTLFSAGSMLSGLSQSMPQLIAMRAIQGLGAGAVAPIVLTMLGDMFTLRERARVQGLFSAVWGLSSIAGPVIGGYITDHFGWPWVFYVSVPFALISAIVLITRVHESVAPRTPAPIDWLGAIFLTASSALMLEVILNGSRQPPHWNIPIIVASVLFGLLFYFQERRAADPILPLDLFKNRTIVASVCGSFLVGGLFFGIETYVPLFIQGVLGGDATSSGRVLTPMFLSWACSVVVAAWVAVHFGFRRAGLGGSFLVAVGSLGLIVGASRADLQAPSFLIGMMVVGLGMGPTFLSQLLSAQHAVAWNRRGVATGVVTFSRTIGGAIGVGLLGATLSWNLTGRLRDAHLEKVDVASALRPESHERIPAEQLAGVRTALGLSLRSVYGEILLLSLGATICCLGLPGLEKSDQPVTSEEETQAIAAAEST